MVVTYEELALLVEQKFRESTSAEEFKKKLLELNLQLARELLQSLCQMAAVTSYTSEADDYIGLNIAIYEIRRAIIDIETAKEPLRQEQLRKIVSRMTNAILGLKRRTYYIHSLFGASFVNSKTTYAYIPYTLLRAIITRDPTIKDIYPSGQFAQVMDKVFGRLFQVYRRLMDVSDSDITSYYEDEIEHALNQVEDDGRFYIFSNLEIGYFHLFEFTKEYYLNLARMLRYINSITVLDARLKVALMTILTFMLLQLPNVELKISSHLIRLQKSTAAIYARLNISRLKGLNLPVLLWIFILKFGRKMLPIELHQQRCRDFGPEDLWNVGFHITTAPTVYKYDDNITKIILPKLYKKFNEAFIKEVCKKEI